MDREYENPGAGAYAVLTQLTKVDRWRGELNSLPLAVWQQVWTGRDFSFCWNGALLVSSDSHLWVWGVCFGSILPPIQVNWSSYFWGSNKKLSFFSFQIDNMKKLFGKNTENRRVEEERWVGQLVLWVKNIFPPCDLRDEDYLEQHV